MLRKLSKIEITYLKELKKYDTVLNTTMLVSRNRHGINTTGRGVRAVRIFTRQTLTGMSLRSIMPFPTDIKDKEEDLWDIGSIASLARNILEGYLSVVYFGADSISDDEAELRFFLCQYHRNKEWYSIRKQLDANDPELEVFETGLQEQKERIKKHPYISGLTKEQKNKAIRGHEIYKTKSDFEADDPICKGLRRDYQLLSNFVHPLPLSIERIDNLNGRGIGSEADITYCIKSLVTARRYLAATTITISDFFYDNLAVRFKNDIDSIREFVSIDK